MTRYKYGDDLRARLESFAAAGLTRTEVATELRVSYLTVHIWSHKFGIQFRRAYTSQHNQSRANRADDFARRYQSGETLAEIGRRAGISRERVRQILTRTRGFDGTDGGQTVKTIAKRREVATRRDRDCLARWGCTHQQYRDLLAIGREMVAAGGSRDTTPTGAYRSQKNNARARSIEWRLTLWQWWQIWLESGRWDDRGRGHSFMMCRKGDAGPYAPDNVVIAPGHFNASCQSRKKSSLPTGVSEERKGRFVAKMGVNGKINHLGIFPTPELAHAAYLKALSEIAGPSKEVA